MGDVTLHVNAGGERGAWEVWGGVGVGLDSQGD